MKVTETKDRVVALAGQPNCGKSSVFTMLTGVHQHIANYPGITVDIKKGYVNYQKHAYKRLFIGNSTIFSNKISQN